MLHSICAFANDFHNLGGGYIVVGVAEQSGRPVLPPAGLEPGELDAIQKELLNLGHSAIQPMYHPLSTPCVVDGKWILVIWVPGGETRPYKARVSLAKDKNDWAYYLRKQSSTVRAKGADEQELISLAATVPFDDRYNQQAAVDDLSPRLIEEFLREVGSELADEVHSSALAAVGRQMNIVGGPSEAVFPKNAGLLFFNDRPQRFFPATQIDVVWFPDGAGGDRFEEKTFAGPLARMTREALDYIQRNYLKETVVKHPGRAEAERFWNFPYAALEEAVVNAVYHRSYEIREPVEVRITPDDLVVLSFPGADRSIRMDALRAGKAVSRRYRNRRIGEFLKELDLAEGRSTGIPKILREMGMNGSPAPEFESDDDRSYYLVRLPAHPPVPDSNQVSEETKSGARSGAHDEAHDKAEVEAQAGTRSVLSRDQVEPQSRARSRAQSRARSRARSEVILHALSKCPYSTNELMLKLKLKSKTGALKRALNELLSNTLIEYTIPDKPASRLQKYRLTEKGRKILENK